MTDCNHEWRLTRTGTRDEVVSLPSPPGFPRGNYTTHRIAWDEWYCVHCRHFETLNRIPQAHDEA